MVIENPFGRDLVSAQQLNTVAHQYFDETQTYRIDHYLGKETVQNILVFWFANPSVKLGPGLWPERDHSGLCILRSAPHRQHGAGCLADQLVSRPSGQVCRRGPSPPNRQHDQTRLPFRRNLPNSLRCFSELHS